ncbi:MXAN_6640 family putative metalloprotease [Nocardioides humi]|uniref:Neutral metalloprotease n=1 Tax=Nocardioides humi TaxID=449461 RepID=A0ABN2AVE0_9ACTN|nr:MXAN_6640 family putative metalloprotease [Nocardioides humi]
MSRRSHFPLAGLPLRHLFVALLAALLAVSTLGTVAQADPAAPADPAVDAGDPVAQEVAEQALETVREMLEPVPSGATSDPVAPAEGEGADLTMALRDLAVTRTDLPTHLQDDAGRLLARPNPTDPVGGIECSNGSGLPCYTVPEATPVCGSGICVHRVASTADAASASYANVVLGVLQHVAGRYAAAGYRPPVGDGAIGTSSGGAGNGSNVFDVYLADLGQRGLYGYCTTDQRVSGHTTAAAYCVLDNNYAEYGAVPGPLANLQVTAAHEYFHAVQFAYDVNEETWLLEATAVWAEDELYDDINDNRQYLRGGPLGLPAQPLDYRRGLAPYGAWIFFKFLSERYPAVNAPGGLPTIVRDVWELAAGAPNARQALGAALGVRGTDLRKQFGWFAAANRRPAANYSEGAYYPTASLWRGVKLSGSRRSFSASTSLKHLASRTVRFKSKFSGKARLRVHVDAPNRKKGSFAVVTIKKKGKPPVSKKVKINKKGNKTVAYPFGKKVKWVEVTVANSGKKDGKVKVSANVR